MLQPEPFEDRTTITRHTDHISDNSTYPRYNISILSIVVMMK